MAERKSRKKAEEVEKEEVEETEPEHKMIDLNVTAEERGYEVPEETLAPENELKDDPAGEQLNEPDAEDESDEDEDSE